MSSEANNEAAKTPAPERPDSDAPTPADNSPAGGKALPSVIVDPSLSQADETAPQPTLEEALLSAVGAPLAVAAESAPDPETSGDDGWSAGSLSEHEADRFADTLRASWDVAGDASAESWSTAAAPTAHASVAATRDSSPSSSSDSIPPLVMSRGLDRRMLAAGGSIVVVVTIAVWSMVGGESEVPPSWDKGTTSAAGPQAVTPTKTDAPAAASDHIPAPGATAPDVVVPPPAHEIPTPVAAEPVAPTLPTPTALPTPTPTPPPTPAAPASIHLRISTSPASADIKLDGDAVPNPFDAWLPRTGSHVIAVSADGFVQRDWDVIFDEDRTLALALKREPVRRPAARRAPRVSAPPRTPTPTPPSRKRPRGAGFVTDNPY